MTHLDIEWAVTEDSGSYLAFKIRNGGTFYSQPQFAVDKCIEDLRTLYALHPNTTGLHLNVIFPNG